MTLAGGSKTQDDSAAATAAAIGRAKSTAKGRKDSSGQEGVPGTKPLKDALKELDVAFEKAAAARKKLNDLIKKVAEDCNMQAAVIRKAVNARSDDKIEAVLRNAEQLEMALNAIAEEE